MSRSKIFVLVTGTACFWYLLRRYVLRSAMLVSCSISDVGGTYIYEIIILSVSVLPSETVACSYETCKHSKQTTVNFIELQNI